METWKLWRKAKTLWNFQVKRKKAYGIETETDNEKRKTLQGTEKIEFFLDSLKRYKVMGGLSGKDFDVDKIVQYSKHRKEISK